MLGSSLGKRQNRDMSMISLERIGLEGTDHLFPMLTVATGNTPAEEFARFGLTAHVAERTSNLRLKVMEA